MQREIIGKLLFEAHQRLFSLPPSDYVTLLIIIIKREREKIDASIKINKNPLTRLSIQTFITYKTDFDDTICCNEKFPPLHIFFLFWQTSPFTLPDNLTICKIASPPGLIPDLTSHGDLVSSRWRMLRQSFFSVKQAFEILSFLIVN